MILYHAARQHFDIPNPIFFDESRDFGPCLYTSLDADDAIKFCDTRLRTPSSCVLELDVDIDHIEYTHTYNNLDIYVFDDRYDDDVIQWMRQVIGNRIVNNQPDCFQYLMNADIYVGYRADGDLDKVISTLSIIPGCLHDEEKLLQLYDNEILKQYEMETQIALTANACKQLVSEENKLRKIYP